jgi:hypothetical protein
MQLEPYEGKEPYIFVSYSHQNMDMIRPVLEEFERASYRYWFDEGIALGDDWTDKIGSRVLDCSVFIVFISKNSTFCYLHDIGNITIQGGADFCQGFH